MVFWQLSIDANDPVLLARFWAQALGYQPAPPAHPETTWHAHYRARLGEKAAFADRLFDPAAPADLVPGSTGDEGGKEPAPPRPLPHRPRQCAAAGAAERDRRGEGH